MHQLISVKTHAECLENTGKVYKAGKTIASVVYSNGYDKQ